MSNYYNRQWRLPNNENKSKQSNYSMDFDGSSDISISGISVAGEFTLSAWVKGITSSTFYIFGSTNSSNWLRIQGGNAVGLKTGNGQLSDSGSLPTFTFNSTDWFHIVVTRDSSNNIQVYVNNSVDPSYTPRNGGTGINSMANPFVPNFIGQNLSQYTTGKIDAVCIFDYALSSSQITTLYGSSSTGIGNPMTLNPVAYYPLGDQDSFNGADYLVPNSSLKDYVFFVDNLYQSTSTNGITMGSYSDTAGLSAVSWSLWINLQVLNSASGYSRILNSDSFSFATNASNGGQNWTFAFVTVNGTISKNFTLSTALQNQGWVNIIGTYDGTNTKFYLNTAQQGTQGSGSGVLNTTSSLNLGYFYGSNSVDAYFSNFSIWNKALSTSDISEIYNSGSPSNLSSHSSTSNLINWWKLDASDTYDGTNWNFEDHAGSSNATSSGMTQANLVQSDLSFTSGYSPYALDFDGTDDSITIPNSTDFDYGTGDFTWSFWLNIDTHVNYAGLFYFASSGTPYRLKIQTNSTIYLDTGSNDLQIANLGIGLAGSGWHSLVFVRNSGTITTYLDGIQVDSALYNYSLNSSGLPLIIGDNSGSYLNGKLSNISIWNAGLTSSQVSEIYNEGVPSNLNNHSAYSNLVSWWQLGSNSSFNTNWTVLDEKGSNNGTSVNMTEADIVDGVGSYANGLSSGMGGDEIIGSAPFSDANSLSVNMDALDRVEDTPN